MKKTFFLLLISLFISFFIDIPSYVELNDLVIVEGIGISCSEEDYKIYIKEIIPTKDDTGMNYKYKIYESDLKKMDKFIDNISNEIDKKVFYKDLKYIITDCDNTSEVRNELKIKPKYIKHVKDVKKEMD